MFGGISKTTLAVTLLAGSAAAIDLDIKDEQSIKDAAKTIASSTMNFYSDRDSDIPGIVSSSMFWEGSVLFSVMMRYWALTGDDSHNDAVSEGMYWVRGDNDDYMPANYSSYLGNDDQLNWGLAAMMAAEVDFPQKSSMPSWATLAENVWNSVSSRWDDDSCDGGLRWQIWAYQSGYGYKNAASNGGLFELSARLAHYTKNQTYSDWAEKIWDWSATTPLLKEKKWNIADTTSCEKNCSDHGDYQWTFNYGLYMSGAAYMYNVTEGESKWRTGLSGLLNTSQQFFPKKYGSDIMSEFTCEPIKKCDRNQILFKGLFAQELSLIAQVAPYTESDIMYLLQGSALGAAATCTGGKKNDLCSTAWYKDEYDGSDSIEQQISVTSVLVSNLVAFDKENLATQSTAKNSSASGTTTGSASATSSESTSTETGAGDKDNGAGVVSSGPIVLITAMLMGVLSFF
ncbi:hypothetical protein PENSTE_c002G01630 [Penicillium steckii]|uniref:Mannan endo-1,6-alpha-mannosidase n=1 Tax=Penicillium steckii TaxID=303698 RepID=A0A1V6TVL6_9EURO|nr:hypothetical protein PENSTE_c002G01630 [Penicillium steckii]